MKNSELTEKDFSTIFCDDLSIQELSYGKNVLVLMCQEEKSSLRLLEILRNNQFKLNAYIDDKTGEYKLDFHFVNSDIGFLFETKKTVKSYPPMKKVAENGINYLTTGVWDADSAKGRTFRYSNDFIKIGDVNIAQSFKYASGLQFFPDESGNQPAMVILTFDDYEHIYATESNDAFDLLFVMSKNRLHCEFIPNKDKISLRIWDIMIDLDLQIENLSYSKEQFNNFRTNVDESESFGFVIGFTATENKQIRIASTKQNKADVITLHGYAIID